MKKKKIMALVLSLAMVMSMGFTSTALAADSEPVQGGDLVISSQIPTSLEWSQVRGIMEIAYFCPIYETLMRYSADGTPECYLLDSMTSDADALTWTMEVKQGIQFSDGSDLNADVVAWNLNYYKENGILSDSYYANFDSAEATDDYTVVCHFSEWDALFDYSLCRTTLIASKQAFDDNGAEWLAENPVGTGPFTLESYTTDVEMTLVRNDNYWQGTVNLDSLQYVYYAQEVVAATAVQTGEIDGVVTEAYSIVNQILESGADLTNYVSEIPSYSYTLCFNMQDGDPFADQLVREAVSYAIDPETINETLTYGYGSVTNQWALEGTTMYNDEVEGQPYDVDKAKELLEEAGYPDGFSTTITYSSTTLLNDVATMIKDELAQINVDVELRPIEGSAYANYIGGWEEGMLLHTMGYEAGAPSQYSTTFIQDIDFGLGMSMFNISDELDEMSRAITTSKTDEELIENTYAVAKDVFDDEVMCKVVLVTSAVSFTTPKLQNSNYNVVQNLRYDVWDAWLEE